MNCKGFGRELSGPNGVTTAAVEGNYEIIY
jgi:hypothetical protein